MKNLYLIDTQGFNEVLLYDTEHKILAVLDVDADKPDFKLSNIDSIDYGVEDKYFDVDSLEDFLGIENWFYGNSEGYILLDEIEGWE